MTSGSEPTGPHPVDAGVLARNVSLGQIFKGFLWISVRAWGGGAGTTLVMQQDLVRRGWITAGQFALDWGLSRIVPGINLLAMAVMVGYRLAGTPGALVGLTGFMLPASIITVILTVGFVELTQQPLGIAAVKGAVAVTAAMTYALALENARGVMPRDNPRILIPMLLFTTSCFLAVVVLHLSAAVAIILGGLFGAFCLRPSEGSPSGGSPSEGSGRA
jgi:chromate transporter